MAQAAYQTTSSTVSGIVRSVNPKGFKLDGSDEWLNFSKFAEVTPPERGQSVTVALDKQGFVRAVEATGGSQEPVQGRQATNDQRERRISRLAVLKAAAEFGASRSNLKSGDVLLIAESWERWINREDDTDNVDAL